MIKKIDMYNLHKNHTMGYLQNKLLPESTYETPYNATNRIMNEGKGNLLDLDKDTFFDSSERKIPNWTLSSTMNMYANPVREHYKGRKLNLDEIHLDDFYYDFDTVKIFKVDNPTLEKGFPTTDKGYLYIFNRYNVNRMTRFYMDTENNYDTPMLPYFSGHVIREQEYYKDNIYKFLNLDNGVNVNILHKDYIALGDNRLRQDLKGSEKNIGFRKFLGDTDCIVQMYVTKDRTYTRSSNGKFTVNFFESMGEVNFLYNRRQYVNDPELPSGPLPTNELLDGKSLIWGYNNSGDNNDINSVVFLDEHKKYTIKRPYYRNSDPGNTNHFDLPDYSFIPNGLIFTEAGFFRDGVTSDEELKNSLKEYNELWKAKPENKRVTKKRISYNGSSGEKSETDEAEFVNYDIIKNVDEYLKLEKIPSYFYPKPSFLLEGEELNNYLNHLGNLYTGDNFYLNYHEPWDTKYYEALCDFYAKYNIGFSSHDTSIEYEGGSNGVSFLRRMQNLKGLFNYNKTKYIFDLKTAKVSFMEAAKKGYPFKSNDAKALFKKDRNPMEWTPWTSFYYPHSDRHNKESDSSSNIRHHMNLQDVDKIIRDKYNLITSTKGYDKYTDGLFQGNINLDDYVDNENNAYLSGHFNNTSPFHGFTGTFYSDRYIFNTRAQILVKGEEIKYLVPGMDDRHPFNQDAAVLLLKSDLSQGNHSNEREVIGDFSRLKIESKAFPKMINTYEIKHYENDVERHYREAHEILSTSHMKFKLLINYKDSELPRDRFGISPKLANYQSFTIPSDDWSDIYIDFVEYVDGYLVKYPRFFIANLPDEINTCTPVPGIELERKGNSFKLITSKDSTNNYLLPEYKSKVVNNKTLLIKKVWWR